LNSDEYKGIKKMVRKLAYGLGCGFLFEARRFLFPWSTYRRMLRFMVVSCVRMIAYGVV